MTLKISHDRGVNARITTCVQCGKDRGELLMLGTSDYVCYCSSPGCSQTFLGTKRGTCPKCKRRGTVERRLDENEKIPTGLCDECDNLLLEEHETLKQEVAKGGVYFKCKCGSSGVIKHDTEVAALVRKKAGIEKPHPVGLELDTCSECFPTEEGT